MTQIVLVVLLVAAVGVWPADAGSLAEKREELHRLLLQLTQRREQLRQAKQQEHRVLGELEGIDRNREAAAQRLTQLAGDLRQSQARVQTTVAQLAVVQRELAVRRDRLRTRLRDIYKYGQGGYADVLLGTGDFAEFVTRWRFVSTIVRADSELIADYTADVTRYQYLYETYQEDKAHLRAVMTQTEASKREIEIQEQAKRALLRQIQGERGAFERAVRELEANSRDLEVLIKRMQSGQGLTRVALARELAGFLWPTQGPVTSGFGIRRHPIFGIQHMHTGVDIGAVWGAPVLAAGDGQVIYTGWFGGYGKIVVVDHGEGLSTLYAHLLEILVSPGASVRRGQVLGRVGTTGYSTGPHLHFEVRVDGRPIDPVAH